MTEQNENLPQALARVREMLDYRARQGESLGLAVRESSVTAADLEALYAAALRSPVEQQPTRWLLQPTNNKERVRRTAPDEVEMIFYASRGWVVTPLYAVQQPASTS